MKLHGITWLFIGLGVIEFIAQIYQTADTIRNTLGDVRLGQESPFILFGILVPSYFYALNWLGTAAMVEVLIRIWEELRAKRLGYRRVRTDPYDYTNTHESAER